MSRTEDEIRRIAREEAQDVAGLEVKDSDGEPWSLRDLMDRFQITRRQALQALGLIAVGYHVPKAVLQVVSQPAEAAPDDNLTVPGTLDAGAINIDESNNTQFADPGDIQETLNKVSGPSNYGTGAIVSLKPNSTYSVTSTLSVPPYTTLNLNGATVEIDADVDGIFLDLGSWLVGPGLVRVAGSQGSYTSRLVYLDTAEAGGDYRAPDDSHAGIRGYPYLWAGGYDAEVLGLHSDGGSGAITLGCLFEINVRGGRDGIGINCYNDSAGASFVNGVQIFGHIEGQSRYHIRHYSSDADPGPAESTMFGVLQPSGGSTTSAIKSEAGGNSFQFVGQIWDRAGYTGAVLDAKCNVIGMLTNQWDPDNIDQGTVLDIGSGAVRVTTARAVTKIDGQGVTYAANASEPIFPDPGDVALSDGSNWDPLGNGNAGLVARNAADNDWVEIVDLGGSL